MGTGSASRDVTGSAPDDFSRQFWLQYLPDFFLEFRRDFHEGGNGYKIDYSAVAAKSRCVVGIGLIA